MGVTYAHEHLIIDGEFVGSKYPDFKLDRTDLAIQELAPVHGLGVRTMIDSMPTAAGRNVVKLAQIEAETGIRVVVPTGLHLDIYYPEGHWSSAITEEALAELFVEEITVGIDRHDRNGSEIDLTPHRAGVIKVASGLDGLSHLESRNFIAAANAHVATGCPILTHTEQGTAALDQVEILQSHGVNLSHVVLSHLDRKPDVGYHREVLSTGVKLEYDSSFRWRGDANPTLDLLVALLPEYPDQIMLGMDAARTAYWRSYGGGPGMDFLVTNFKTQMLAAGISPQHLDNVFIHTPAHTYCFAEVG